MNLLFRNNGHLSTKATCYYPWLTAVDKFDFIESIAFVSIGQSLEIAETIKNTLDKNIV